jgi:hypothetical protein
MRKVEIQQDLQVVPARFAFLKVCGYGGRNPYLENGIRQAGQKRLYGIAFYRLTYIIEVQSEKGANGSIFPALLGSKSLVRVLKKVFQSVHLRLTIPATLDVLQSSRWDALSGFLAQEIVVIQSGVRAIYVEIMRDHTISSSFSGTI